MLNIKPVKIVGEDENTDINLPSAQEQEINLPPPQPVENTPPEDDKDVAEFTSPNVIDDDFDETIEETDECKPNRLFGDLTNKKTDAPVTPRKFPYIYVAMGIALLKYFI